MSTTTSALARLTTQIPPFALAFLVLACDVLTSPDEAPLPLESSIAVTITPTSPQFAPGTWAPFTIANNEDFTLIYNLCFDHLEVRHGATWSNAPLAGDICPAIGLSIPELQTVEASFHLAPILSNGEYRIRVHFSTLSYVPGAPFVRRSSTFVVRR